MPSKYKIHPAANIFPMLSPEEFAALKSDIETNGQLDDIAFFDDLVIDGRNRLLACEELGIEPQWYELTECKDPVAYVLSKNLHRRHLTPAQAGMCAAKVKEYYAKQAKERMKRKPNSAMENLPQQNGETARDAAGKAFGVSGKQVDKASKVIEEGSSELITAVETGQVSLDAAEKLIAAVPDKREQAKVAKQGKKAVAAKIKEGKPQKKADGGAESVTSGPLAGMEPDPVGDLQPGAAAKFRERLIGWTQTQFNNIDDLSWQVAASVFLQLGDECETWN